MFKGKKKIIAIAAAVLVIAFIGTSKLKPLDLETAIVERGSVALTVTEKGRVVTEGTTNIFPEVGGTVKKVSVEEGQYVNKGTVLAELDTTDTDSQIARVEGELKAVSGSELSSPSGAGFEQSRLALEEAQNQLDLARSSFERINRLYSTGGATFVELEQARTELETKKKAVAQAEAALNSAGQQSKGSKLLYQGQKESLMAQLNQLKNQKMKARIIAETDGIVLAREVNRGDYVSQNSKLFVLGGDSQPRIETFVSTRDVSNLKKGSEVVITFKMPGTDIEVPGSISKIAPQAQEVLTALGIAEYKVKVTVVPDKIPSRVNIIPGMEAEVGFKTREAANVLHVPAESLFKDRGKDYVWAVRDGSAVLVQVDPGIEGDDVTEIRKGLGEKDIIILDPHQENLKEGIKVKSK